MAKWQELVEKHLLGKKIVKVKWLEPKDSERLLGWEEQPLEITLDNGVSIVPSSDDEGNNAGSFFTNIKELPVIPVFRK